jgi:transmembrane sensor
LWPGTPACMHVPDKERILNLLIRKLTGEASAAELEEMELLLQKQPAYRAVCEEATAFWHINHPDDTEFLEATYLLHLMRLEEKGHTLQPVTTEANDMPPKRRRKWWLLALPALALLLATGVWLLNSGKKAAPVVAAQEMNTAATGKKVEVSTKNGDHSKIQLPDGSQVWLNAGSKIDYDKSFDGELREVYLTGEAFFDVVHNEKVPFIVHTRAADIRVLGTAFNVKSYANDLNTETSLIRGSVEVSDKTGGQKWILKPNEKLVITNLPLSGAGRAIASEEAGSSRLPMAAAVKRITYDRKDSVVIETAWLDDKLCFTEEPFSEVAKKMERKYDVEFEFVNPVRKEIVMYGSFRNENLQQALEALLYSFDIRYEVDKKKVKIY